MHEPKLCAVDISAQHKSSVHQILARQRSDPQWLTEHALPYGVVAQDKYGCKCSNLCTRSGLGGLQ
jgi:hypothetical protein